MFGGEYMSKQNAYLRRGKNETPTIDLDLYAADIKQRSITPTTHKYRDIYKDNTDLQSIVGGNTVVPSDMSDASFYCDTYYHSTWRTEILHFGINALNSQIKPELADHNSRLQLPIIGSGTSLISNASNVTVYPQFAKQVVLTRYENELISTAISYIANTASKKVVLVDTFPRELKANPSKGLKVGDIEIPQDPSAPISTHTVILYKNSLGQFLVIDPNSPQYSGHLQNLLNISVSTTLTPLHKPYAPQATATPPNTGPNPAKYRDCVDIAVKLASLLDNDVTDYISTDDVMKSDAVKLVSNNKDITKLPIFDQTLRIKQVSDLLEMQKINQTLQDQLLAYVKDTKDAKNKFDIAKSLLQQQFEAECNQIDTNYDAEISALIGQVANNSALEGDYA